MERIRNQVLTQITDKQIKKYIQENIFNTQSIGKYRNQLAHNHDQIGQINSSSMLSSYHRPSGGSDSNNLSIKTMVNKIEKMIILNGFFKNIEQIKDLKGKFQLVKRQNKQLQRKIQSSKAKSTLKNYNESTIPQENKALNPGFTNCSKELHKLLRFDQQITSTVQRLEYSKLKSRLISLVKLSKLQKQSLLQRVSKQHQRIKRHIQVLERVIQNVENVHPEEGRMNLQVQMLQEEYDQKSRLVGKDGRLEMQMDILERKLQTLQKGRTSHNPIPKGGDQHNTGDPHPDPASLTSTLLCIISRLQSFITEQQEQKGILALQIKQFSHKFNKEKKKNQSYLTLIQQNFFQSSQVIDYVMRLNATNTEEISFLFDKIGMRFN